MVAKVEGFDDLSLCRAEHSQGANLSIDLE